MFVSGDRDMGSFSVLWISNPDLWLTAGLAPPRSCSPGGPVFATADGYFDEMP